MTEAPDTLVRLDRKLSRAIVTGKGISKRNLAIAAGAILTDKYGPVEHTARLDIASGERQRVKLGETQLTLIEKIRARNAT